MYSTKPATKTRSQKKKKGSKKKAFLFRKIPWKFRAISS